MFGLACRKILETDGRFRLTDRYWGGKPDALLRNRRWLLVAGIESRQATSNASFGIEEVRSAMPCSNALTYTRDRLVIRTSLLRSCEKEE